MNKELLSKMNQKSLATVSDSDINKEIDFRYSGNLIYPLHVFHHKLNPLIEGLVDKYKIDRSFVGTTLISALSTSAGTAFDVSTNNRDRFYLLTWCCIVGSSSSGKTLVMDKLYLPLLEIQGDFDKAWEERIKDLNDAELAKMNIEAVIVMDVYVPTMLRNILPVNHRGICKVAYEINEWVNGMNAGKKNNEGTDEQLWLKIWNCSCIKITRGGNQQKNINRPFVNIIGGTQYPLLSEFFKNNREQSGFTFRMLFAFDERRIGIDADPKYYIPENVYLPYKKLIYSLYKDYPVFNSSQEPIHCVLDEESVEFYQQWYTKERLNANNCKDVRLREFRNGILGKMKENSLKFAAILALSDKILDDFGPENKFNHIPIKTDLGISLDVFKRAVQLAEYYMKSAELSYQLAHSKMVPKNIINLKAAYERSLKTYGKINYAEIGRILFKNLSDANQRQKAKRELDSAMKEYPHFFNIVDR
jgi:hypothetical protein